MIDIVQIQINPVIPCNRIASMRLRIASQTGSYIMPVCLFFGIPRQILYQQRPRSHNSHISLDDIEKLRQFVKAGCSQCLAECSESHRIGEQLTVLIPCICHRSEFVKPENLLVPAGAFLCKDDR